MAEPDDFTVHSDCDGAITLECPVSGCRDLWTRVDYGLTLTELRAKAAEHLAEKHVDVLDGQIVPAVRHLTA